MLRVVRSVRFPGQTLPIENQKPKTKNDAIESQRSWERSAQAWIKSVDEGDRSRTEILDPVMLELAGEVEGLDVLDAGCGEGRFARMLVQGGARVVGLEPARTLVEAAAARDGRSRYVRGTAEQLPFPSDSFDLVVSYLVIIDVPDYQGALRETARVLRPQARLIVASLNPFVTSQIGWVKDEQGKRLHYPIDQYCVEKPDWAEWAGIRVLNWHRPMQNYMQAFLAAGLILRDFREPHPTPEAAAGDEWLEAGRRVPFFHTMMWQKP